MRRPLLQRPLKSESCQGAPCPCRGTSIFSICGTHLGARTTAPVSCRIRNAPHLVVGEHRATVDAFHEQALLYSWGVEHACAVGHAREGQQDSTDDGKQPGHSHQVARSREDGGGKQHYEQLELSNRQSQCVIVAGELSADGWSAALQGNLEPVIVRAFLLVHTRDASGSEISSGTMCQSLQNFRAFLNGILKSCLSTLTQYPRYSC